MSEKKPSSHILLGFDFGTSFIGVAVGQTITKTARALTTLKATRGVPEWDKMDKLVKTWNPEAFVIGIPLNMDGTEQFLTELAKQFSQSMREHYQLPVYDMDERLSTIAAREQLFNEGGYRALEKKDVDSYAAQLILENWLKGHSHDL